MTDQEANIWAQTFAATIVTFGRDVDGSYPYEQLLATAGATAEAAVLIFQESCARRAAPQKEAV